MSTEIAVVIVLAYIGWSLERVYRMLRLLVGEISSARWEAGIMARKALLAGGRSDGPKD